MSDNKQYLGDGVYVEFDGFGITLSTERSTGVHYIYLEDFVYEALRNYVSKLWELNREDGK